ncbi:hypothetical protein [Enterococcus phage vB_Efs22_KEN09]
MISATTNWIALFIIDSSYLFLLYFYIIAYLFVV